MSTSKNIDRICIIITAIALLITVLFMNGEKLGIEAIVDEDAEKYSALDNFTVNDQNGEWDTSDATVITLNGDSATVSGKGAYAYNGSVVITNAGKYVVSGTLTDGYISVDAYSSSKVWILLDGVNITSSDNAALRVDEADKVFLTLAEGSENILTGGAELSETALADGTGGAIFAHDDLTINGSGSLKVIGNYKHGIDANDDLVITSGTIYISAPKDGMHVNDSLRIMNADITVEVDDDGLVVSKENGYLHIESGIIRITSGDDAIHTTGDITIDGGTFEISAGDDGIHSDTQITINDCDMLISKCYEGIEAIKIDITGGSITIYPSDDGLNANGGSDGFGMMGGFGRGGWGQMVQATAEPEQTGDDDEDDSTWVRISGGEITIINENARDADGIDSNGDVVITGGTIRVSLPGGGSNNAIDYGSESGGTATISGGSLAAAGGSAMAENFDASSEQCVIMLNLSQNIAGGTLIQVLDADGNEILSYAPPVSYNSVYLSSPEMKVGETYTIVYGEETEEVEMTSTVVTAGNSSGGFGGGMNRGGGGRGRNRFTETPTTVPESGESTAEPTRDGSFEPGSMMPPDGTMMAGGGNMPDGERPEDGGMMPIPPDGEMPEFDGTMTPPADMPGRGGGMRPEGDDMGRPDDFGGFDEHGISEEAEEEDDAPVSTAKSLSEFGAETWILLGASVLAILVAILYTLKFKD